MIGSVEQFNRISRPCLGLGRLLLLALVLASGSTLTQGQGAGPESAPPFEEVYSLVASNLTEALEPDLNQAAVAGFVEQLHPKVMLVPASGEVLPEDQSGPLVTKTNIYRERLGYLRIGRVAPGLAEELAAAYQEMSSKEKLGGLILDLRFASGLSYLEAGKAGDLFVATPQMLLQWGDQEYQANSDHQEVPLPVAVLVNQKTAGAAEALAALLRETGVGMLIGGQTAGQALVYQEYPLSNGQRLRISTSTVKTAGQLRLTAQGLTPDIPVKVDLESQRTYYEDAFAQLGPVRKGEQSSAARRINEAELVRRQSNEGFFQPDTSDEPQPGSSADSTPELQDPVLLRALDLLKALAVVQPFLERP